MNLYRPSCAVVVALIATQVLGPAVLWAADQRGIRVEANRRVVVAAISGEQLVVKGDGETKALHFHDVLNAGDQLTTGDRTVAEVLIGNRAVVTLGQGTTVQLTALSQEQTTVQVKKGIVRVAASAEALGEQGKITIQTATGLVQTRGGILRVMVDTPIGSAEYTPIGEARPYRASYAPNTMVAAVSGRGDIIQVEEGAAEIPGAGPGGKTLTVKSGQSVTMQSGQARSISGLVSQGGMRAGVLASAGHNSTPKEGVDNLVALQVNQATALGKALTGAAETGAGDSGKKDESKNAINGATGGVSLASNSTLVNSLFGGGSTANTASSSPQDRLGAGFGGNNNNGFGIASASGVNVRVNGGNALLVFTTKDPVQSYVKEDITLDTASNLGIAYSLDGGTSAFKKGDVCSATCLASHYFEALKANANVNGQVVFNPFGPIPGNVVYSPLPSVKSQFTVKKELVLVGGALNIGHGGIAPTETLIVRGATATTSGDGLFPTDRTPAAIGLFAPTPPEIVSANSTFVVESSSTLSSSDEWIGGTLGQYSNLATASPDGIAITDLGQGIGHVDGAITATGSSVVLTGGVTLDQGTTATIGKTTATDNYFSDPTVTANLKSSDAKFNGSLLAVINGPTVPTSLTVGDRLLGVYDGSTINTSTDPLTVGNKALLSVLDAKLTGPASVPLIDIADASHFNGSSVTPGSKPDVIVTSAVVIRTTMPLDGALLEASAPLFALTNATMTTTSHFADLAGNADNKNQALAFNGSLVRGDSLVALNAATLTIQSGNLLNLNNATASITGYLFSLIGGSTLNLNHGTLFSLTGDSSLNLNGNAFGVFGSGNNTLSIANNLCPAGACGQLVNSANQPFLVNGGTSLQVAGVTHNVVLPNNFNVFALAPGAPIPHVNIGATDALFKVDGTSTLTINGTTVVP